ncbi:hypothetical protein [Williamsoniiplasma somnilux]|uniref:hypothetical protein n=1 Tax=Williamsoniiplasma somnilux TaxID=215578 RepID=UPI00146FBCE8|nr:hypothetical protein [Williamsoniiplasma somnilux]
MFKQFFWSGFYKNTFYTITCISNINSDLSLDLTLIINSGINLKGELFFNNSKPFTSIEYKSITGNVSIFQNIGDFLKLPSNLELNGSKLSLSSHYKK